MLGAPLDPCGLVPEGAPELEWLPHPVAEVEPGVWLEAQAPGPWLAEPEGGV